MGEGMLQGLLPACQRVFLLFSSSFSLIFAHTGEASGNGRDGEYKRYPSFVLALRMAWVRFNSSGRSIDVKE